jgi:N-carbamoylputrescine amidase
MLFAARRKSLKGGSGLSRIGLGQFTASSDREHNLTEVAKLIGEAAQTEVDLLCFHELATTTYFCYENNPAFRMLAESDDGKSVTRVRDAAAKHGVAVVFPFYERVADGRLFNSAVVIGKDGAVLGKYRKMSIPSITRTVDPNETPGDEQFYFTAGDLGFPVFDVGGLKVGILICYDRHFVEAARVIGLQGADILFVPTATYRAWIRRVWEAELIGHAIANGYYVAGVNRVGVEPGGAPNRSYFGSSLVIDPTGEVMARASDSEPGLLTVDISAERVADVRDLWGFFRCRRPDAYRMLLEPVQGQRWPTISAVTPQPAATSAE